MGAIVIRTRFDEGTESAEVATSESFIWCDQDSNPRSATLEASTFTITQPIQFKISSNASPNKRPDKRHITEILLKVALSTIKQTNKQTIKSACFFCHCIHVSDNMLSWRSTMIINSFVRDDIVTLSTLTLVLSINNVGRQHVIISNVTVSFVWLILFLGLQYITEI